jgi:protein-S-isoprenylcysteine O-methyltransferase Ste14
MQAIRICRYLWIGFYVIWLAWAFQSKKTQQRAGLGDQLLYRLLPVAALFMVFAPIVPIDWLYRALLPHQTWMGSTGVAITVCGFGWAIWARSCLGSNWSSAPEVKVEHQLIRSGPYRWTRHPIYSGLLLALAGTTVALDEWRGGVALVLLWFAFFVKSRQEEQYMRQVFGNQYDEYCRSTGALLPRLSKLIRR